MKKLIICFFLYLCWATTSSGQAKYHLDKDTSKYKNSPLWLLQLPLTDPIQTSNIIINSNDIDSIIVYKDSPDTKLYGDKAFNGLVKLKTKKFIKVLYLDQLLELYHISADDRHLPVFIDSVIAYQPKKTLFETTYVKSVKIEKEKDTASRYISIRTFSEINHNPNILNIKAK
ncbi:MAG TPA: hypothetical protein VGN20_19690 [Mucilaginibacter sp.]|jgi:hypothetical protein